MTREEAISLIKSAQLMLVNPTTNEPVSDLYEALDMAIRALSQEPCTDAVSREAVDKYIVELLSGYLYDEERERLEKLSAYLWELPSVQPSRKGRWIWCVGSHKCTNCEEYTVFSHKELLRFCPNCGAKMVEPPESEEETTFEQDKQELFDYIKSQRKSRK